MTIVGLGLCSGTATAAPIVSHRHTAVAATLAPGDAAAPAFRAATPTLSAPRLEAQPGPDTAPSIVPGLSRPGLGWTPGLPYPPDQFGAIGPDHYVQGVTNGIAVFRRSDLGMAAGPLAPATFAAAPAGAEVVDTQMMWDAQTSRWYYAFTYKRWQDGKRTAGVLYGWSRTPDPTDLAHGWCRLRIDNGADFDDRPKLGDNRTHLIVATNANPWFGADFDRVWTMPKPADGDTSCPASQAGIKTFGDVDHPLRSSDGDVVDSAIAAQDNDGAANGWVVAADDRSASDAQIMLWHVNASGDLVANGNVAVSPYSTPPAPPQPASNQPLDPVDQRLGSAVADTDPDVGATALWTSQTIADPSGSGRSVVRWYELVPGACSPVKDGLCPASVRRQQGEVRDPSSWLFNAAMAPTDSGDEAVLHYDAASASQRVQIRARSRGPGAPLGTLGAELVVDTSDAPYDEPTCHDDRPFCRWGDYAAATTDPSDPHAVWGSNQAVSPVNGGNPNWKTRNFALRPGVWPAPSPTPTPDPTPDPGPTPVPPPDPPGPPAPPTPGAITVMTRELGGATGERLTLAAREITQAGPDLAGLQGASDPGLLVDELIGYRLVARSGGNAVLARSGVKVANVSSGAPWDQLDATVRGHRIHFVNAHLGARTAAGRLAQARALARGPLTPHGPPVVLVGDLGSGPRLASRAARAPYLAIAAAGLREARRPAFTCCFAGDLRGGAWKRSYDHVMARPGLTVLRSWVTGFAPRTPGGLAASTHGGVVSVLRPRP